MSTSKVTGNMPKQVTRPHLFTIRVWLEEGEEGQSECRGRLQYGLHGAAYHFQGWAALIDLMNAAVHEESGSDASALPHAND